LNKIIKEELEYSDKYLIPRKYIQSLDIHKITPISDSENSKIDVKFYDDYTSIYDTNVLLFTYDCKMNVLLCANLEIVSWLISYFEGVFEPEVNFFCFARKGMSIQDIQIYMIMLANGIDLND